MAENLDRAIQNELGRGWKFEAAQISQVDDEGLLEIQTGDRDEARSKVGKSTLQRMYSGNMAVVLGRGESDQPVVLGQLPWIVQ